MENVFLYVDLTFKLDDLYNIKINYDTHYYESDHGPHDYTVERKIFLNDKLITVADLNKLDANNIFNKIEKIESKIVKKLKIKYKEALENYKEREKKALEKKYLG